uniref:THH1/TOM1/TOM3 domain-containing protein n=1 Tax=Spongospora subterranea TaxID=70186 RepID=A0A0H5QKW6_9EUKA|eukprot:CRZ01976.1 hypothetical protein [Spongospora subterranea]
MLAGILILSYASVATICVFQLARIAIFKHSLVSFQTAFLSLGFLWSASRVIFFSADIESFIFLQLCLYWIPIDLQFATFSLICVFYAFLVYERQWNRIRHCYRAIYLMVNGTVISLTLVYIYLSSNPNFDGSSRLEKTHQTFMSLQFLLLVATYAYYGALIIIAATTDQVVLFSLRRMSTRTIIVITVCTWLIFLSRCIYNFLNLFGLASIKIGSESGSTHEVSRAAFLLSMIWEIVPTTMLLLYFREIPRTNFGWRTLLCCNETSVDVNISERRASSQPPDPDLFSDQSGFMASLVREKQESSSSFSFGANFRTRYDTDSEFSPSSNSPTPGITINSKKTRTEN